MRKMWIVTAVDVSETADGKARVLAVCRTKEEADAVVTNDMESYVDDRAGTGLVMDEAKRSVHDEDYRNGCEWNAEEVEIPD